MAVVGSGNVPDYPGALDQAETRSDGDTISANFQNDIQNGWVIIQQTLGTNPQGTYPSVVTRLDAIERRIATGTATITSGSTGVTVTHNLNVAPQPFDITLMPTTQATNDVGYLWVETLTTTQMTIRCYNDPGASGLSVAWRATAAL